MKPYRATPMCKPIDSGEFVFGWYTHHSGVFEGKEWERHQISEEKGKTYIVHPSTVGQQVGIQDKHGKRELHAGDRITVGHDRGVLTLDEYDLAWGIELDDDGGFQAFCRFYTDEEMRNIEYLGNIHEAKAEVKE